MKSQSVEAKRCRCGAVTVTGDGFVNHMRIGLFRRLYPRFRLPKDRYGCCDHCVNHWGVDLCGCGSGKPAGRCNGEFPQCKAGTAYETLGEQNRSSVEVMFAAGGWRS